MQPPLILTLRRSDRDRDQALSRLARSFEAVARRMERDEDEAKDLAQEALIHAAELWASDPRDEYGQPFGHGFYMKAGVRRMINLVRLRVRRRELMEGHQAEAQREAAPIDRAAIVAEIDQLAEYLPAPALELLRMKALGLDMAEIGEELGVGAGAASDRVGRAVRAAKKAAQNVCT